MKIKFIKICVYFVIGAIIFIFTGELIIRIFGWKELPFIYTEVSDPDVRWVHTPNYRGPAFATYVEINSKGLRDYEYGYEKPKDTFRILAIGECTTFGHSTMFQNSFPKQLGALLNERLPFNYFARYEVINAGVCQYDELQKFYFLKKYCLKYNPDLIIFSHDIDNKPWIDINERLKMFRKLNLFIPKNIYFFRYLYRNLGNFLTHYFDDKIVREKGGYVAYIKERYREGGQFAANIKEALEELSGLSEETHIPVMVTLFPWLNFLEEDRYHFRDIHSFFKDNCQKLGLPFLDFYEDFFKNKNEEFFWIAPKPGFRRRPNPHANKILAEEALKFMLSGKVEISKINN